MIYRLLIAISVASSLSSEVRADVESAKTALAVEKKIIKVFFFPEESVQWNIGMEPDGSPRYGYAGYVCQILAKHVEITERTWVRTFNVHEVATGKTYRDASMGRINCKTFQKMIP